MFGYRVHLIRVAISFEKNFHRLPFTPSLVARSVLQLVSEPIQIFQGSN
jgi:hypothetical protein